MQNGPAGLKGADLQKLYEMSEFDAEGEPAQCVLSILNELETISGCEPRAIRTRWGLVDLTIVLIQLRNNKISVEPNEVMNFFRAFEENRRAVGEKLNGLQTQLVNLSINTDTNGEEVLEEIQLEIPEISSSMLTYYLAFTREGATEENVHTRSQIMYHDLLEYLRESKA